ncbi:hypothetical protein GOV09_02735 [Candidatus Woesearchaeota archaeon]|nr:hypothetical protein [Candidatus Woesearchaeota archaeon]
MKKKSNAKKKFTTLYLLLGIALIVIALLNVFQTSSFSKILQGKLEEAKEAARPAKLELVAIVDSRCEGCMDMKPLIDSIKNANVELQREDSLEYSSNDAKELIREYSLDKAPALLLFGEIDRVAIVDMEKKDDALVFMPENPPYTDTATKQIRGRVSAQIIEDSSCTQCSDISSTIQALQQSGIFIASEVIVERSNIKGQQLIEKYGIEILPTVVLSNDMGVYESDIVKKWPLVGKIAKDGSYILTRVNPPFLNISNNAITGLVSLTILSDIECDQCFDAGLFNKPILERLGVVLGEEQTIDISSSEGKSLISAYNIEKVPTIILTGDVNEYPVLMNAWKEVGTEESDGTFVFRNVEIGRQPYRNLDTNEIIEP